METSIFTAIIVALSTLFGVALTNKFQLRVQRNNHQFQLADEESKRKHEQTEKERTLSLQRLATTHRLLSIIGREFSRTNLNIIWRAEMEDREYDQRYLSVCQEVDELRAIAGLHETSLTDEVETIHGLMNIFWGNFKDVLRLTSLGEKVTHQTSCFASAHGAAMEIEEKTFALKKQLTKLAKECHGYC